MLDVYVSNELVGVLDQPDPYTFVFNYLPNAPSARPVSLLMPKRMESWVNRGLHPVFQISLPEGSLRDLMTKKFSKRFKHFGDLQLLTVIGENMIGRITVMPHGQAPSGLTPHESLTRLISAQTTNLVDHFLGARLQESGVSGGFMKFLAKSHTNQHAGRPTLALDDWIIKLNDDDHPHIVLLEYFGLMAARAAGLTVPDVYLSQDSQHLLVKRFDITANGNRLGFEDMCALFGLPAEDKFTGSVERMIKTIGTFCQGQNKSVSLDQFFGQYLLATTMRNGDAHLKNFALIYDDVASATLAPGYDVLSMAVYAPVLPNSRDADDGMALSFQGTKRWLNAEMIRALATRCLVSDKRATQWKAQIATGLVETADKVVDHVNNHPKDDFAKTANRMLELWAIGLDTLDSTTAEQIRDIAATCY
jgi:serine/threonine-protein kinase HipA